MAPFAGLRGIGPATAALLTRVTGGTRVLDLLFHLPESFVDRRVRPTIRTAQPGTVATLAVEVVRHEAPVTAKQPWRVVVGDGTGFAELVFFKPARAQSLALGSKLLVSGKLERFGDRLTMPHPDHMVPADQPERVPAIEPVWPLTAGLFPSQLRGALTQALAAVPDFAEWHDASLMKREGWPSFAEALRALHAPAAHPGPKPRARLAYDELLAHQIAIAWVRTRERARPGRALVGDGALRAQALRRFGHALTPSQAAALAEIDADLAAPNRMLRLLQGDVGSGKTLVAAMALLRAVEAGAQAALMAPTETLARQHHRVLGKMLPVPVALLSGSVKGIARRNTLLGLQAGRIPIVVGTHALFQEAVHYKNLGLAVIDEQHRFGVDQRLSLGGKGDFTDVLVMTATPIPRTLLLTQWGEMAVSRLSEKPAGRQPIKTTLHSLATLPDVIDGLARALDRGERAYWVCPMVDESELIDIAAAEERFRLLRQRFGARVGLAHGKQDSAVREGAIAAFARGEIQLLVATTVIEVGVDVPEASVMLVEHAERFGLAQLHQLRGRVGRGAQASFCLLLHEDGLNETARRRLLLLRDTEDGFVIADEDFRIRGGGDMLGKRQSGQPGWRLADPVEHEGLLRMANRDAAVLLERDPKLTSERGLAVRVLLRMFERGAAVRTLGAG
jgi:ATP-dependent DNA helicase RecG